MTVEIQQAEPLARELAGDLMTAYDDAIELPLANIKSTLTDKGWSKNDALNFSAAVELISRRAFLLSFKVKQAFNLK